MADKLLSVIPTIQSIQLVESNLKKKKKKGLVRQGIDNIIGSQIISETSNFLS